MEEARKLVEAMTVEEKVAQMFFIGFHPVDLPERYAEFIERNGLGGIILFTRNVKSAEQTRALTASAQAAARRSRQGLPLAISIDQEGGIVVRMSEEAGYTHMPGNMALGAADDETLTYRTARIMAAEMRAVGVNWNLAPVLDVNNNPTNPVIGVRSYGEDPSLVARHGVAAIRGFQSGNVAACAKHFPGHGDTAVDSHLALPVIPHGRDRLKAVELAPFQAAFEAGLDSVMTAHVFFPALEPTPGLPATLSRNVMTGLLREEMGFEGVICSDCLEMKAIADNYSHEQTAIMAVEAGVDALLISHTWDVQMAMYQALVQAVKDGRVSESRIDESACRVVRMKLARGMDKEIPSAIGTGEHKAVALEAARRAVTVVSGAERLPLSGKVTLVMPRAGWLALVEDSQTALARLMAGLSGAGLTVDAVDCAMDMANLDLDALAARVGAGGTVILGAFAAARNERQVEAADRLAAAGCKVVVLARRMPYDLGRFQNAAVKIAMYDDSPAMQQATAELLTGKLQATGRLPVTLNQ